MTLHNTRHISMISDFIENMMRKYYASSTVFVVFLNKEAARVFRQNIILQHCNDISRGSFMKNFYNDDEISNQSYAMMK